MAGNIGRARMKVSFLSGSPFGAQPKQEVFHYFSQDNLSALNPYNIEALPPPLNGVRLTETLFNYDNYLNDGTDYIEDGYYNQTTVVYDISSSGSPGDTVTSTSPGAAAFGSAVGTVTSKVPTDPVANALAAQRAKDAQGQNAQQASNAAAAKNFFTWVITPAIFQESPPPPKFADPPKQGNTPAFTLKLFKRPGGDNKAEFLTPYMTKSPPDNASPIHWGAKMSQPIAQNQPFEIVFFYDEREPSPADQGPKLTPVYQFLGENGQPIDLFLHNSIYVAIEFGISDANHHYLMIFQSESAPALYKLNGTTAKRFSVFNGFNSSVVFNPNNKYFSVKLESVMGSLIVRSNAFHDTPWMIVAPLTAPVFIGKGNLGIYSGNVQGGWAMRPVQYEPTGDFSTPDTEYTQISPVHPKCSTAVKGAGSVQQDMSYTKEKSLPEVNLVDAELVNGTGVNTFLEAFSGETGRDGGVSRKITTEVRQVKNANAGGAAQQTTATYNANVTLNASDVSQGGGYTVSNGRSPYIWLLRCGTEPAPGGNPGCNGVECDLSCDVLSLDLSFNATSYNELTHNGTLRILNKVANKLNGKVDYRSYINRAVYIKIEAWWEIGVGHDPGQGDREIFEGIAFGGTVETKADNEVVVFKLEDYMSALMGGKFILCPAYDGMAASLAVRDIMLQTGFPDNRILTGNVPISKANLSKDFGLPFHNIFTEPTFKFKDGSSYKEGILKLAKIQFRSIYFDRKGNFHYDEMPGGLFVDDKIAAAVEFWSSPIRGNIFAIGDLKRIAWNMVSFSTLVNDVYNVIQINSVDKLIPGARLSAGMVYKEGLFDPTATGYLGFRKHLLIADPIYGSVGAINKAVKEYASRVFIPPISAKFEIYGYTGLKPLDIIKLDGQRLRIMNINTHMSAQENQYWQTIEGEWFFSIGAGGDPAITQPAPSSGSPGDSSPGEASTTGG